PSRPAPSFLVLRARETSWLEVRDGDGTTLFEGSFEGEKRFPLTGPLQVRAGRPHAVTVAVGEAAPRALGTVQDLDWQRFTPPPASAP
ncbi:MAG: DUF4115 domain-containing protein, partial [Synechococcaceae cyanobacterium]|nr:DUF4115 domain-containing protein [Synechococcaceae cyanobacterium]